MRAVTGAGVEKTFAAGDVIWRTDGIENVGDALAIPDINDDDIAAIIAYLRSIKPINNVVPGPVKRGERTSERFVYFGVYQNKIDD